MTLTRRARELVIVAMLLALPLLFLRANVKAPNDLNAVDRIILRISAPLQSLLTSAGGAVARFFSNYFMLVGVKRENTFLKDENARLRTDVERLRLGAARTDKLEHMLELRSGLTVDSISARIIGVETSPFFRVVRLRVDRGEGEVRAGAPVLASEGVVGRVQRVFGPYSDVLLAVDPKSSIDVVIPRTGARGVLKGIAGSDRYRTRMEYLVKKDDIAVGNQVVTSGVANIFPRDVAVGKVVKVEKQGYGLYQEVEVDPAVDFGKLTTVLVVTPPAAPEKPRISVPEQE